MDTAEERRRASEPPEAVVYDGFMSYSHAADDLLAPRLQTGLQRFAKPWWRRRALRVFRDEASLSANPHLWSSITEALDGSAWFVLLLSPEASASVWVNREVEYWLSHKDASRIVPVVTDGEFGWAEADISPGTDSAPPALYGAFGEEPRWVDLRWARSDEQLDLNNAQFRNAVADIASALRGVAKDELESEEVKQHRRTIRTAWTAGIALATLAVIALGAALYANDQQNRANELAQQEAAARQAAEDAAEGEAVARAAEAEQRAAAEAGAVQERQNLARELAAASVANLTSADPELSLLLAIEGAEQSLDAGEQILPEVVDALHRAVINPRPELVIEGGGSSSSGQLIEYSVDGSSLVALADDGGAMVIDPLNGNELGRIPPVGSPALAVEFHPDGRRVLTHHADAVRQWAWSSGELDLELELPNAVEVTTASYSRDGSAIAIGGEDGVIRVWDAGSQEFVAALEGHTGRVSSVSFDPTGERLISGGFDATALVWDIASEAVTASIRISSISPVRQVSWHPFADAGAITTTPSEMYTFATTTGERINSLGNGQSHNTAIAYDATGALIITAGEDGFARIFGTFIGGEAAIVLPTGGVPVRDAAFDPRPFGISAATIGLDGRVRIWSDLLRSELPARLLPYLFPTIVANADGNRYVFNAHSISLELLGQLENAVIEVIDASTGESLISRPTITDGDLGGRSPAISGDGAMVAFAGPSGDVEIVTVDSGTSVPVPDSANWTASLSFSSDGSLLAGGGYDGSIAVWDVANGRKLRTLDGHGDAETSARTESLPIFSAFTVLRVDEVAFRPASSELASAGFDGTVRVWDTSTGQGKVVHTFDYSTRTLAYSPDGSLIAAADMSGTIAVVDADTGQVLYVPERVSGRTEFVFSPDGRFLAGAGPGPIAHLWEMETGRIVRRFQGAIFPPRSVAFVNGGTQLRVASGEGVDRGYVLNPLALVELARNEVTRDLTDGECELYLRRACDG